MKFNIKLTNFFLCALQTDRIPEETVIIIDKFDEANLSRS